MKTILLLLLLIPLSAFGEDAVYKCESAGSLTYSDKPCGPNSKKLAIQQRRDSDARAFAEAIVRQVEHDQMMPQPVARQSSSSPVTRTASSPSFKCVSAAGVVFYRHDGCPAAIDGLSKGILYDYQTGNAYGFRYDAPDPVTTQRVDRSTACSQIYSSERRDSTKDQRYSTYDRNLGRDPCR